MKTRYKVIMGDKETVLIKDARNAQEVAKWRAEWIKFPHIQNFMVLERMGEFYTVAITENKLKMGF